MSVKKQIIIQEKNAIIESQNDTLSEVINNDDSIIINEYNYVESHQNNNNIEVSSEDNDDESFAIEQSKYIENISRRFEKDSTFKKQAGLIQHKGVFNATAIKAMNIICKIYTETASNDHDKDQGVAIIPKKVLTDYLGWKHGDYKAINKALEELKKPIVWNRYNVDKNNAKEWKETQGLSLIAYYHHKQDTDLVKVQFPEPIKKILLAEKKIYATLELAHQKNYKNKYTLMLVEYFSCELGRLGRTEMVTEWYTITDLRDRLNVDEEKLYVGRNRDFLKNCIYDPIDENNDLAKMETPGTNILFNIHDIEKTSGRGGQRISALKFYIKFINITPSLKEELIKNSYGGSTQNAFYNKINKNVMRELTSNNFFSKKDAEVLVGVVREKIERQYPDKINEVDEYIIANISYCKKLNNDNKIKKTMSAAIQDALLKDYAHYFEKQIIEADKEYEEQKEKENKQYREEAKAKEINDRVKMKEEYEDGGITLRNMLSDFCIDEDCFRKKMSVFAGLSNTLQIGLKRRVIEKYSHKFKNRQNYDLCFNVEVYVRAVYQLITDDGFISTEFIDLPFDPNANKTEVGMLMDDIVNNLLNN